MTGLEAGWVVGGAAAAMTPILIHLWASRRPRTLRFPAARFLRAAPSGRWRRRQLRDVIILILRCAAVCALAAAFAKPEWLRAGPAALPGAEGKSVVIVLDASASMQRTSGGLTLFDAARARARRVLEEIDLLRDRAAVILLHGRPRSLLPELTANVPALLHLLDGTTCTLERGDADAAMRLASTLSAPDAPAARAVLVLSDMQAMQWRAVRGPINASLRIEPFAPDVPDSNLAIADLAVAPPRPVAGRPTRLSAVVRNFGSSERSAVVAFLADGDVLGATPVELPPWGERLATVAATFDRAGSVALEARVVDAGFNEDDAARAGIEVVDSPRAALISDSAPAGRSGSTPFLRAALEAGCDAPPMILSAGEAINGELERFDCIAIAGGAGLDDRNLESLARFAARGGTVLWVIDSRGAAAAAELFRRLTGAFPFDAMTPAMPPRAATLRPAESASGLDSWGRQSPILHAADGLRVALPVVASLAPPAQLLLDADAGPVAATCAVGRGVVSAMVADLSAEESDLQRSPAFPAVVHLLMNRGLEAVSGGNAIFVGEAVGHGSPPTNEPGFVAVRSIDRPQDSPRIVGVNIHPDESDGRPLLANEALALTLRSGEVERSTATATALGDGPASIELWPYLAASAMMLLACEGWLRQRPVRRREGRHDA